MTTIFMKILSMSLTASYCILFVCAARLLLKKAPKIFSYLLWTVVAFRLICPFSFESSFSLVGNRFISAADTVTSDISAYDININDITSNALASDALTLENFASDNFINTDNKTIADASATDNLARLDSVYQPFYSENKLFSYIWAVISALLLGYGAYTYIRLKRKLKICAYMTSKYHSVNVWQVKELDTPFVLGFLHPAIFLPEYLTEEKRVQCLAHEYTHIRRKDYLIKQLAFILVCVYWFNPLIWLAFYLMTKDMEMSCDEVALRSTSLEDRKVYSNTLLELSTTTRYFSGCPLAFGANSTKSRIKNIMNYKKPGFWVILLSIILVVCCIIGLSANPKSAEQNEVAQKTPEQNSEAVQAEINMQTENAEKKAQSAVEAATAAELKAQELLQQKERFLMTTIDGKDVAILRELLDIWNDAIDQNRKVYEALQAELTELYFQQKEAYTNKQRLENSSDSTEEDKAQNLLAIAEINALIEQKLLVMEELNAVHEEYQQLKEALEEEQLRLSELCNKYTEYLNSPENNVFVTTIYHNKTIDLAMLLYDAAGVVENTPADAEELKMLARENINNSDIMCHITGEQINSLLQSKMGITLADVMYTEEIPNTLKEEWIYLKDFDTYTQHPKGDKKLQNIKCININQQADGSLILEYQATNSSDWIQSGILVMVPKTTNSEIVSPDDFYFYSNIFTEGGYTDEIIVNAFN